MTSMCRPAVKNICWKHTSHSVTHFHFVSLLVRKPSVKTENGVSRCLNENETSPLKFPQPLKNYAAYGPVRDSIKTSTVSSPNARATLACRATEWLKKERRSRRVVMDCEKRLHEVCAIRCAERETFTFFPLSVAIFARGRLGAHLVKLAQLSFA